jgi:hypothetical protein
MNINVNDANSLEPWTVFRYWCRRIESCARSAVQDAESVRDCLHWVQFAPGVMARRASGAKGVNSLTATDHVHRLHCRGNASDSSGVGSTRTLGVFTAFRIAIFSERHTARPWVDGGTLCSNSLQVRATMGHSNDLHLGPIHVVIADRQEEVNISASSTRSKSCAFQCSRDAHRSFHTTVAGDVLIASRIRNDGCGGIAKVGAGEKYRGTPENILARLSPFCQDNLGIDDIVELF